MTKTKIILISLAAIFFINGGIWLVVSNPFKTGSDILDADGAPLFPVGDEEKFCEGLPCGDTKKDNGEKDRTSNNNDQLSPFGLASTGNSQTLKFLRSLGGTTIRLSGVDAVIKDVVDTKGWTHTDEVFKMFSDSGIEMSVVILGENPVADNTLSQYSAFVESAVERYDGDGVNDAPGSPKVSYWEIDNEPDLYEPSEKTPWKGESNFSETKDYALILKTAYKAVKKANSQAKVAIAGMGSAESTHSLEYYGHILEELNKIKDTNTDKFFDAFNYHVYSTHADYGKKRLEEAKALLNKFGYGDRELIITEVSTYVGEHAFMPDKFPYQSEKNQAISVFKRFLYPIGAGISKIYWFSWEKSLTSSSGNYLSYFTYRLMAEKLKGADWKNIEKIIDKDGVYVYKLKISGQEKWVAWYDKYTSGGSKKVVSVEVGNMAELASTKVIPKYSTGKDIKSFSTAFDVTKTTARDGTISVSLDDSPVIIENAETAIISSDSISVVAPSSEPNPSGANTKTVAPSGAQSTAPQGDASKKCGDGICGPVEKANPMMCPQDCK